MSRSSQYSLGYTLMVVIEVRSCPPWSWEGGEVQENEAQAESVLKSDQVLAWQARGVFMAEEINIHKHMKVNWCSGSQILQAVLIMGSVRVGVRDLARLLGKVGLRRAAMLQKAAWHHKRILNRQLIHAGRYVESSWGARPEAERWLESSRCWAEIGLR